MTETLSWAELDGAARSAAWSEQYPAYTDKPKAGRLLIKASDFKIKKPEY